MCGIIGYVGPRQVDSILLEGLERLEYRGYDSAGISMFDEHTGTFETIRSVGNLARLREAVGDTDRSDARYGVGHTRWATHGRPAEHNAHPFRSRDGKITVVLNGIIENYIDLREELGSQGYEFSSETDAEVVPFLIEQAYNGDLIAAVKSAHARLEGHFAIVVMHTDHPDTMVGVRRQCPLVIGVGDGETYIASAIAAFLKWTKTVQLIEDDEIVVVTPAGARFLSLDSNELTREAMQIDWDEDAAEKGGYETFMLKEINEQPDALENTLGERMRRGAPADLSETGLTDEDAKAIRHIVILGCGTSYHAGLVGRYMLEAWAGVHAEVDLASEWRHRSYPLGPDTLVIGVTQSGETADTLAAMELARERGAYVLAVTNVLGSQATRVANGTLYTRAGLEIGVAATKTHVAQVMAFAVLAMWLAEQRESMDAVEHDVVRSELERIPDLMRVMLASEPWHESIRSVAERFQASEFFMFLGRHVGLPVSLEAALKLKEISYIPSDAYAAGEMKHGPIALLDEDTPTVVIATDSHVYEKVISNIQEVRARGAAVIVIATEGNQDIQQHADHVIYVPRTCNELMPLLGILPLQLLSYHIASMRGLNVDQPRNLAKTVTVE